MLTTIGHGCPNQLREPMSKKAGAFAEMPECGLTELVVIIRHVGPNWPTNSAKKCCIFSKEGGSCHDSQEDSVLRRLFGK